MYQSKILQVNFRSKMKDDDNDINTITNISIKLSLSSWIHNFLSKRKIRPLYLHVSSVELFHNIAPCRNYMISLSKYL